MLAREKGVVPGQDPIMQLSTLSGAEFDREFSNKMRFGHQELINLVDYFCRSARLRINRAFHGIHHNADAQGYRVAQGILKRNLEPLQDGILR